MTMTVKEMRDAYDPGRRRAHALLWAIALLVFLTTVFLIPAQVFAADPIDPGASTTPGAGDRPRCAVGDDISTCLPAGRWGPFVGSIDGRLEPGGIFTNLYNGIQQTTRTFMPNMILMVTQVCWSSALSLSSFAANFSPLADMMKQFDGVIGKLADNIMAGGIPATFLFLAVMGWVGAAGFQIGSQKAAIKRGLATVLCLAAVVVMGGAAQRDANADAPAVGSPWWVVSTIDDTINNLTVSLDMDELSNTSDDLMATNAGGKVNCQTYLQAMHDMYKQGVGADDTSKQNTSSVTLAINRVWEETALRNWVTMQWGSPTQNANVSAAAAENAQVAYCHVLEAQANTDPTVQAELTNTEFGGATMVTGNTARYLFSEDGWTDPWNSSVNDKDDALDRGESVYRTRMATFWETCSDSGGGTRAGWTQLINGLGNATEIKNYNQPIRPSSTDPRLASIWSGRDWVGNASQACEAALNNQIFNGDAAKDAAALGWTFDAPNLGATYRLSGLNTHDDAAGQGVAETYNYLYNNSNVDMLGSLGAALGSIVNLVVWGLLSIVLIISKVMLGLMGVFLIAAFLVRAFPFGDAPAKALTRWFKVCCQMCMVGMIVSAVGAIATFLVTFMLNATSGGNGGVASFMYNIVAGMSPLLAFGAISLFCTQILKIGNPFSIKAMTRMAGGTALAAGIGAMGGRAFRNLARRGFNGFMKRSGASRLSSMASNNPNGANESANILSRAAGEQAQAANGQAAGSGNNLGMMSDAQLGARILQGDAQASQAADLRALRKSLVGEEAGGSDAAVAAAQKEAELNTVGHSFDETREKTGQAWAEHRENYEDALARNEDQYARDVAKYENAGVSPASAEIRASVLRNVRDARTKSSHMLGQAVRLGSTGAAFALAAARSKPLRQSIRHGLDIAKPYAKTAAKVGVGALAMSNPITAPLGLAAFASAMNPMNRNTRATVKGAYGATKTVAGAGAQAVGKGASMVKNSRFGRAVVNANQYRKDHTVGQMAEDAGVAVRNAAFDVRHAAGKAVGKAANAMRTVSTAEGRKAVAAGAKQTMATGTQAAKDAFDAKVNAAKNALGNPQGAKGYALAAGGMAASAVGNVVRAGVNRAEQASNILDNAMVAQAPKDGSAKQVDANGAQAQSAENGAGDNSQQQKPLFQQLREDSASQTADIRAMRETISGPIQDQAESQQAVGGNAAVPAQPQSIPAGQPVQMEPVSTGKQTAQQASQQGVRQQGFQQQPGGTQQMQASGRTNPSDVIHNLKDPAQAASLSHDGNANVTLPPVDMPEPDAPVNAQAGFAAESAAAAPNMRSASNDARTEVIDSQIVSEAPTQRMPAMSKQSAEEKAAQMFRDKLRSQGRTPEQIEVAEDRWRGSAQFRSDVEATRMGVQPEDHGSVQFEAGPARKDGRSSYAPERGRDPWTSVETAEPPRGTGSASPAPMPAQPAAAAAPEPADSAPSRSAPTMPAATVPQAPAERPQVVNTPPQAPAERPQVVNTPPQAPAERPKVVRQQPSAQQAPQQVPAEQPKVVRGRHAKPSDPSANTGNGGAR